MAVTLTADPPGLAEAAARPAAPARGRTWTVTLAIGAAAAFFLFLATLGTRGRGNVSIPPASADMWRVAGGAAVGFFLGAVLAIFAFVVLSLLRGHGRASALPQRISPPERRHWALSLLITVLRLVVLATGVVVLLRLVVTHSDLLAGLFPPAAPGGGAGSARVARLPEWAMAVGALGACCVALLVLSRLGWRYPLTRATPEVGALAIVDHAIDVLEHERDPRRAVIAAFRAMEELLAAAGAARRPSEAPFEYVLRNPLLRGQALGAAHRLTELFEAARFSLHVVDETTRGRALVALEALRVELSGS